MSTSRDRAALVGRLASIGCIAPEEEADELLGAATDAAELEAMIGRRTTGEPLAWIVGSTAFCGRRVLVDQGVYVPRPQTEALARRAIHLLPANGIAYDVCTGSGAIAAVLAADRPAASIIGLDLDEGAVACARRNGVDARQSDLLAGVDAAHIGKVDLVVAVVPYVPTEALALLPSDVTVHEDLRHYDGGEGGTDLLRRLVTEASSVLRPGGWLLLELGGDQADAVQAELVDAGFEQIARSTDDEGDVRSVEARRGGLG